MLISSTGSELKAVEEACREASRTVEAFRIIFQQATVTHTERENALESIVDGQIGCRAFPDRGPVCGSSANRCVLLQ
jgi:hypothetical protein